MSDFVKLGQEILMSTMITEDPVTFKIWICMLVSANADGYVSGAAPGFAQAFGVSLSDVEAAIAKFESPDKYSRTKDHEGRRIVEVPGGYKILNYQKYREMYQGKGKSGAERQREYRARKRAEEDGENG